MPVTDSKTAYSVTCLDRFAPESHSEGFVFCLDLESNSMCRTTPTGDRDPPAVSAHQTGFQFCGIVFDRLRRADTSEVDR